MIQNVIVNVSAFSESNPEHRRIWDDEIQPIMRNHSIKFEKRIFDALRHCFAISKPAAEELHAAFNGYHRQANYSPWMFGVYCGGGEPSLTFELSVPEEAVAQVKLQTIQFGESYKRKNVHLLRSFGRVLQLGESIPLAEDETCELCWLAGLNQMNDTDAVFAMAQDAGLENLSVVALGTQLLIYTMGNIGGGPIQFEEAYGGKLLKLRNKLRERNLLNEGLEKTWHARLSNYGSECSPTHDYAAAKRFLQPQLSVSNS